MAWYKGAGPTSALHCTYKNFAAFSWRQTFRESHSSWVWNRSLERFLTSRQPSQRGIWHSAQVPSSSPLRHSKHTGDVRVEGPTTAGSSTKITSEALIFLPATKCRPPFRKPASLIAKGAQSRPEWTSKWDRPQARIWHLSQVKLGFGFKQRKHVSACPFIAAMMIIETEGGNRKQIFLSFFSHTVIYKSRDFELVRARVHVCACVLAYACTSVWVDIKIDSV